MRYWWVNQNQTYRQEIEGGYIWSPTRKANNSRNPFYEFMRIVAPGDIVFSFCDTYIRAIGIASSYCHESPKPVEFRAGGNWSHVGWKINVRWMKLRRAFRPKDHMDRLAGYLPIKYSPLTTSGNGLQNVYLTEVPLLMAHTMFSIIGPEASQVTDPHIYARTVENIDPEFDEDVEQWEAQQERSILHDASIRDTEKKALVSARRGQGKFRANVRKVEKACRVTKVERLEHLVASHVKPWRMSSNAERLDGENGFLLTPTIDHLFDKGFISFENNGRVIISDVADVRALRKMGMDGKSPPNVGGFSEGQRRYLEYHRDKVLRRPSIRR